MKKDNKELFYMTLFIYFPFLGLIFCIAGVGEKDAYKDLLFWSAWVYQLSLITSLLLYSISI